MKTISLFPRIVIIVFLIFLLSNSECFAQGIDSLKSKIHHIIDNINQD